MSTILFISTSLPPTADSQTIRNAFLINGLLRQGHIVHLLRPSVSGGDPSIESLVKEPLHCTITARPAYDTFIETVTRLTQPSWFRSIALRACARLSGSVCVPDVRVGWGRTAYRAAIRAFGSAVPDAIISSSGSNTAHIAACRLSARWARPWIAEFGDPWSMNPLRPASYPHIRWLNAHLERRTLSRASGVVFTTPETRDAFRKQTFSQHIRSCVIPCGYDSSILNGCPTSGAAKGDELVIAYVGTASRGSRDLSPLIEHVRRLTAHNPSLPSACIRFVGSVDRSLGAALTPQCRVRTEHLGWRSYNESIDALLTASGLLLIGNRSHLQVPAKVYNYIASGKPILYLPQQPLSTDPTWQLLRRSGQCFTLTDNHQDNEQIVKDFYMQAALGLNAGQSAATHAVLLSWEEAGDAFAAFIGDICRYTSVPSNQHVRQPNGALASD